MTSLRVAHSEESTNRPNISSLRLLSQLQAAQHEVMASIALMESITSRASPDPVALTTGRFKISRASFARRQIWNRIREHLKDRVRPTDSDILGELTALDLDQARVSSAHVARWPAQAVLKDWRGYQKAQKASRAVREHMTRIIDAEKKMLLPLLYRYR
jgi:hypothetical protein